MFDKKHRKWAGLIAVVMLVSLILSACSEPDAEVVEKEVTRVVKETVIQQETVKETVIIEGTPQVVEQQVTRVVEVEKVVTATPEPEKVAAVGGTLVWALPSEPDTLDPHKTARSESATVMGQIGGALVARDAETGEIVPYLAERWEVSEDGLTWTFYLKEGVTFHDGTPCTAHDYAWTIQRLLDPETMAGAAPMMLGPVASATALDDHTLQLEYAVPFAPGLANLTTISYLQVLPQAAVEELGDDFGRQPIGIGPYMFKEWQTSEKIVLERNPDYANWAPEFDQGNHYIENIEFRILPEAAIVVAGLEAGEIDYAAIEAKDLEIVQGTNQYQIFETQAPGVFGLLFNMGHPMWEDVRVRQAFNLAMNRQVLINVVEKGYAVPQYGPLSPSMAGYWPGVEYVGYPYDLEKAKSLMEQAGYTYNDDGMLEKDGQPFSVVLKTYSLPAAVRSGEVAQEMLKALGVDLQLQQAEIGVLVGELFGGDYELTVMGVAWAEANIMHMMFHSSGIGGSNMTFTNDPELDSILDLTAMTVDPEGRLEYLIEAQRYIVEQAYLVPLYAAQFFSPLNNRVKGVKFSKVDSFLWFGNAHIKAGP